jgi:hypothetical protein
MRAARFLSAGEIFSERASDASAEKDEGESLAGKKNQEWPGWEALRRQRS